MNEEICTKSVWVIVLGSEKLCSAGCHPLLDKPTRLMWQWRKILLLVRQKGPQQHLVGKLHLGKELGTQECHEKKGLSGCSTVSVRRNGYCSKPSSCPGCKSVAISELYLWLPQPCCLCRLCKCNIKYWQWLCSNSMCFKKGHNNEGTREIICKTMLIRHSGTIDREKKIDNQSSGDTKF